MHEDERQHGDEDEAANDAGISDSLTQRSSIFSDIAAFYRSIARVFTNRKNRKALRDALLARPPVNAADFTAVVYFSDSQVNMYQIQQWYAPLVELAKTAPVAVISRNVSTMLLLLEECPLPLFYGRTIAEIEEWLGDTPPTVIFYVNQNMRNFQMMRFRDPAHIFLSHGESDKDYMTSNQLKAYDYTFIAGDAARRRIRKRLVGYDIPARTREIGRPQVDVDYAGPALPDDGRTTILYAPTWEGDRPTMTYSSLVSHGPAMVAAILADPGYRLVYRPHPRTGVFDQEYGRTHRQIVAAIERANRADPAARHLIDMDTPFGWHLKALDACIADVSAVAFDWLAMAKPLVVTEPASDEAEIDPDSIVHRLTPLPAAGAPRIIAELTEAAGADTLARHQEIAEWYFGDITPGASMTRFLAAAADVIAARRADLTAMDPAAR